MLCALRAFVVKNHSTNHFIILYTIQPAQHTIFAQTFYSDQTTKAYSVYFNQHQFYTYTRFYDYDAIK